MQSHIPKGLKRTAPISARRYLQRPANQAPRLQWRAEPTQSAIEELLTEGQREVHPSREPLPTILENPNSNFDASTIPVFDPTQDPKGSMPRTSWPGSARMAAWLGRMRMSGEPNSAVATKPTKAQWENVLVTPLEAEMTSRENEQSGLQPGKNAKQWRFKERRRRELSAILRVVADGEARLEGMRKRLHVAPAFEPASMFDLLHQDSAILRGSPVTAVDLRVFLKKYDVLKHGQEVEALISRYCGGSTSLDIDGFLRMVMPRDWIEERDGPWHQEPCDLIEHSAGGFPVICHPATLEAMFRLAQLIEHELEVLCQLIRCQQQALYVRSSDSYSSCVSSLRSLTMEQHRCLSRYITLCAREKLLEPEWEVFMQLGDNCTPLIGAQEAQGRQNHVLTPENLRG